MSICNQKRICDNIKCEKCFDKRFSNYKGETKNGKLKIDCWNSKKNINANINQICRGSQKKYWFTCDICCHDFQGLVLNITTQNQWCPYCANRKLCGDKNCTHCYNKSFASHQGKTINGKLKNECWNYQKNQPLTPYNIGNMTKNKYWFTCDNCSHDFQINTSNITSRIKPTWCPYCTKNSMMRKICGDINCKSCYDRSLASYKDKTKNGKLKIECLNNNKNNNIKPINISIANNKKYWFNCDICNHSFNMRIADMTKKSYWCPYCSIPCQKLCDDKNCNHCHNNSFASYTDKTQQENLKIDCWDKEKNNYLTSRDVTKSSGRSFWFKCDICDHSFNTKIISIKYNSWCPYCSNQKICENNNCKICHIKSFANYKGKTLSGNYKVDCWHQEKNITSPNAIFLHSNKKYWFICDICNNNFKLTITSIYDKNCWCPICKNKTELLFLNWLKSNYEFDIEHQSKKDWCKSPDTNNYLPLDFIIEPLKLIIEIDGDQHFKQVATWKSPEITFEHDKYKMIQCMKMGYSIIRVYQDDIYNNKNDWKNKTKSLIKKYDNPIIQCIAHDNRYDKYIALDNINNYTCNKEHRCDLCNVDFMFKFNLDKHNKSIHQ